MANMNKFQKKSFECEMLGNVYDFLENYMHHYMTFDYETTTYAEPTEEYDIERLAIIRGIMAKIEKMI